MIFLLSDVICSKNSTFCKSSHNLIVSEKPSVAQAIAKTLGITKRRDGYLEGGEYFVSWCIGHLVELAPPGSYDPKLVKWSKADLPILPKTWQYLVSPGTQKQFEILCSLMARPDVDQLICATDAGREGELIFRLVYHQCGCTKPFTRLWISSMEDAAIRDGFAHLKPSTEYDALYKAALCRERADWLVGINATRLFSCLYGQPLNVGRVMTPTLAMTVSREAALDAFQSEPFYTVLLKMEDYMASSERMKDKSQAEALLAECRQASQAVLQKTEPKEKTEHPPALYDLTSLQRDANRLLGYSAQQTLDYIQALYEKKLVTYPRTDSRYLTEDMEPGLPDLVRQTAAHFGVTGEIPIHAKQVINSKKVSDHHAVLPTRSMAKADLSSLPAGEAHVLRLIAARLLAAVGDPYRYAETTVQMECAGKVFTAKGKTILAEGWKAVERAVLGDTAEKDEEKLEILPEVQEQKTLPILDAQLKEGKTSPPKRFTEDTLLSAMETAGKESKVNCPNGAREGGLGRMPEEAERRGIGTPATRAAIIEKLVKKGFLTREGSGKTKNLIPTEKGRALIAVMPEEIQSPAMTADWEQQLLQIERGELEPETFMNEIEQMVASLVQTSEAVKGAKMLMKNNGKIVGVCPRCSAEVTERDKGWFCSNRECRFVLWKDNAFFKRLGKHLTGQLVDKLLRDGRARLKDCKSQRTGKTYNATVQMTTESNGRPQFSLEFENGGGK